MDLSLRQLEQAVGLRRQIDSLQQRLASLVGGGGGAELLLPLPERSAGGAGAGAPCRQRPEPRSQQRPAGDGRESAAETRWRGKVGPARRRAGAGG